MIPFSWKEIPKQPGRGCKKIVINYQPQLVIAGFLVAINSMALSSPRRSVVPPEVWCLGSGICELRWFHSLYRQDFCLFMAFYSMDYSGSGDLVIGGRDSTTF